MDGESVDETIDNSQEIADKRHSSTSPPPKLPPPGGDVPPYMLKEIFSLQNKNKRVEVEENEEYVDEDEPAQPPKQFLTQKPNVGKPNVGGPNVGGQNVGGQTVGPKNPDLNPLSKLISPLRDILPRNWFQEDKEEEIEEEEMFVPQSPLRKLSSKTHPPNFSPPGNFPSFRKEQRPGPSNSRLPPQNFQTHFQGPNKKFGQNPDPPFRGGQMRGPNYRSQKGPKQNRNNNNKNNFQQFGNPSSFSNRKILRPETIPDIRSSASKLTTPFSVDVDDDVFETSVDDIEETTLRNVLQELSDRATAPAADVGQFHSRPEHFDEDQKVGSESSNPDDDKAEIDDDDDDEEEEDELSKVVEAEIRTGDDQEDLMQPLSSDRKTSTPKKG